MFILREVRENGTEVNLVLGEQYKLILDKSSKEFEEGTKVLESLFGTKLNLNVSIILGLIMDNNKKVRPLFSENRYFIMMGNGSTFTTIKSK